VYVEKGNTMKTATSYQERIADGQLKEALASTGAVQIVGPKWCGKTTTAEQVCNSMVYFQNPDERASLLQTAAEKPSLLLTGDKPLLLDEWQDAAEIWDAVRFAVDRNPAPGQYVLTGSTVVSKDNRAKIMHSGTGRFSTVRMRTMSLWESGDSNGSVSLASLFEGGEIEGKSELSLEDVAALIVRGGWPGLSSSDQVPGNTAQQYIQSVVNSDMSRVDGVEKNPNRVRLLLRSLARNESSAAKMTILSKDVSQDEGSLSVNTISEYLEALRGIYILEEQLPWAEAVRSKVAMRTAPIRRFCDPSLPAALLGMSAEKLLVDFNTFGLLFESLAVRDLRCYAEAADAQVFHYHDLRSLECDAIVERRDGTWGAVEIKLSASGHEAAKSTLQKIQKQVRSQHGGEASFLMVLTNTPYAYRDSDGIYFVPLGCLKP
jgi:predicted AAA+ superfamily ATPase